MPKMLIHPLLPSLLFGCVTSPTEKSIDDTSIDTAVEEQYQSPDFNGDGSVNILIIGTTSSINGSNGFSPEPIAESLKQILDGDVSWTGDVNIASEDIHQSKSLSIELGSGGSLYDYTHHSHSLLQYYYWPDGMEERINNWKGESALDWDHVVMAPDPYILSTTPGYFALGAHKVAEQIVEGGAQPLLLSTWSADFADETFQDVNEFSHRVADGSQVDLQVVPVSLAWTSLTEEQRDVSSTQPSPNGAYLSAAAVYAHITHSSAANSDYTYDDEIANSALNTLRQASTQPQYEGEIALVTPFARCEIAAQSLTYTHTGTSTENGILNGLNWVFDQAPETLSNGGDGPSTFNYGRANINYEAHKRYQIDPDRFQFSFGFPMQDGIQTGDETMLYGMDVRDSGVVNDTDLGVAHYMIQQSEVPYGRAIPLRAFYAQLKEINPDQSAFRDSWHLHRDIDKAAAAYMYTMLTGQCVLGAEPEDTTSSDWLTWRAHKIGCDTAWTVMYLETSPF